MLIAANEAAIHEAAEGVDRLYQAAQDRPVDVLMANAGHGLGRGFLDEDFTEARHVVLIFIQTRG